MSNVDLSAVFDRYTLSGRSYTGGNARQITKASSYIKYMFALKRFPRKRSSPQNIDFTKVKMYRVFFFANKPFAYFSTSLVRLECKLLLGSIDPHARCLTLVSCRHLCTSLLHLDKGDEVTSLERIFITPRPMANTAYSVNHNRCNKAACCTAQTFICTQTRITYSRRALGSFWI